MGEKRFFKVSVVLLVIDLIISIVCGHVLFLFLVVLFFKLFFIFFKKSKKIENFQKDKFLFFYFESCFIFLEDYMNYDTSLLF